jgi:mono/diheme cytochrome c family protein
MKQTKINCRLGLFLLLALFLSPELTEAAEKSGFEKASEMDYGPAVAMTTEAPWPKDNIALKGIMVALKNQGFPKTGAPIGKGKTLKMRSKEIKAYKDLPEIYHKQREGIKGYWISLPKGRYDVTLQFAELKRKNLGERVFDISLQNKVLKKDFDILKSTEKKQFVAQELNFKDIEVSDFLKLGFIRKSERSGPAIAGIIIKGKDFEKKINCAGPKTADYEAGWEKNVYVSDPYEAGILFDTETLRYAAGWRFGFFDFNGAVYNEVHGTHPQINLSDNENFQLFGSAAISGWPLAKSRRYKGLYHHGEDIIFNYEIDGSEVWDMPALTAVGKNPVFIRRMDLSPLKNNQEQMILEFNKDAEIINNVVVMKDGDNSLAVGLPGFGKNTFVLKGRTLLLQLKKETSHRFDIHIWKGPEEALKEFRKSLEKKVEKVALKIYCQGGKAKWTEKIHTQGELAPEGNAAFSIDKILLPKNNPYKSWMRPAALDFFKDGKRLALSTWSGDVWIVSGLDESLKKVSWKRFATGLFHPLGLKIVDEKIYVLGRDQITRLHDLNKDGEADFYENFNNDILITKNFHEFVFDLQTDKAGNFYFSKGSPVNAGGEGFGDNINAHHGCIFKLDKEGKTLEVIATGLRAPNGISVGPEGQITSSDNEGGWTPSTPINWIKKGGFYGVMPTAHRREKPLKRDNVLCFIPHDVDRSAGGQVWVPEGVWGQLSGELLHLSYGHLKVFHVMKEEVAGLKQGGVVELKTNGRFDSGIMRARFFKDQLFLCGLKGWETNASEEGGLYRMRYNGKKNYQPKNIRAGQNGLKIEFDQPLDEATALVAGNYAIKQWVYRVSADYGSDTYPVPKNKLWDHQAQWSPLPEKELKKLEAIKDEDAREEARQKIDQKYKSKKDIVNIDSLSLSDDKKTLFIEIKDIKPVMQMQIQLGINAQDGFEIKETIHNSIHSLGNWEGKPGKKVESKLDKKPQGLALSFTQLRDRSSDIRLSEFAALQVAPGESPSVFLNSGPFKADFEGYIKLEKNRELRFSARFKGSYGLKINGQSANSGKAIKLKKGYNKIWISYKPGLKGPSYFRLYWQGHDIPLEPLPPELLFHDADTPGLKEALTLRKGRSLFAEKNCASCHEVGRTTMPELKFSAPRLDDAKDRFNHRWLAVWILEHNKGVSGTESLQVASDLAAFLSPVNEAAAKVDAKKALEGKKLFAELGCASCHDKNSQALVDKKFKASYLADFILSPQRHNAGSKMPKFKLSREEAQALAAHLRTEARKTLPLQRKIPKGDPQKGKAAFTKLNCHGCHQGSVPEKFKKKEDLFKSTLTKSCLYEKNLKVEERAALKIFIKKGADSLNRYVPSEYATRALKNLKCFSCHTRSGQASNWTSPLNIQNQQPPPITYIGEKLKFESLVNIFKGKNKEKMRPWMKARMPRFKNHFAELSDGLMALQGFSSEERIIEKSSAFQIKEGAKILKQTACITCHAIAGKKAIAPFASPGPDLKYAGQRLRKEYYMRWMHKPQRLMPKSGMPTYGFDDEKFEDLFEYIKSLGKN